MDLSAVRTLEEPGKGGISNNEHDFLPASTFYLFPFRRLNKILVFYLVNELFFNPHFNVRDLLRKERLSQNHRFGPNSLLSKEV
jgi:hypothetical protein